MMAEVGFSGIASTINLAARILVRLAVPTMDRSIPPVIIQMVSPRESNPSSGKEYDMERKFLIVMNLPGLRMAISTNITIEMMMRRFKLLSLVFGSLIGELDRIFNFSLSLGF